MILKALYTLDIHDEVSLACERSSQTWRAWRMRDCCFGNIFRIKYLSYVALGVALEEEEKKKKNGLMSGQYETKLLF